MDQTKSSGVAPDFAKERSAPASVTEKGSTDPATDGGGSRGNSLTELSNDLEKHKVPRKTG